MTRITDDELESVHETFRALAKRTEFAAELLEQFAEGNFYAQQVAAALDELRTLRAIKLLTEDDRMLLRDLGAQIIDNDYKLGRTQDVLDLLARLSHPDQTASKDSSK